MMNRMIDLSAYMQLEWYDPRLSWIGLKKFSTIESLTVDSNFVWIPRITLLDGGIEDLNIVHEGEF